MPVQTEGLHRPRRAPGLARGAAHGLLLRGGVAQRTIALGQQLGKLSLFFTRAEQYRAKGGDIFGNNPDGPAKPAKRGR